LHRPAINYVKGRVITINFEEQKVATIAVEGKVSGMYLEPAADTTRTRPNPRPGPTRAQPPARPAPVPGVRRP